MKDYHDLEWGKPVHDDRLLFEVLILEGAQAGLSWSTILNKRAAYRKAYDEFDFKKVAKYSTKKVKQLLNNPGIVRNRLKINTSITNAEAFIKVRYEFGTFDKYLWKFVGGKPKVNRWKNHNMESTFISLEELLHSLRESSSNKQELAKTTYKELVEEARDLLTEEKRYLE